MLNHSRYLTLLLLLLGGGVSMNVAPPALPPGAIGPYLNGAFPETTPGAGGRWELTDPLPGITFYGPTKVIPYPGSPNELVVLGLNGEVWKVNLDTREVTTLLDIRDRAYKRGDSVTVGVAFHPRFGNPAAPDHQTIFIFYRFKPAPLDVWSETGYNRLSKFTWDAETGTFAANSEEVLIQQYDRRHRHNGGAILFGNDGYLYASLGDEGLDYWQLSADDQSFTQGLFNGIIRIDVDNDSTRSHPIRRQPLEPGAPPASWPETFTQGYSIPNDNPWLDPTGAILEEFYARGTRSPFTMSQDAQTGLLWVGDVGEDQYEEVNRVQMGDNLQWPFQEGPLAGEVDRVAPLVGTERPPYSGYSREFGNCVIGGAVYRGGKFPSLYGKYLFADWATNRIMAVDSDAENPGIETLIGDIRNQTVAIPDGAGITGVYPTADGEIYVSVMGDKLASVPGKLFRLRQVDAVPEPPSKLSDLGAFADLATLTPAPGVLPYRVNASLYSDGAGKQRWMALPNDGTFDDPAEQIQFSEQGNWAFPEGTVFIKHFELQTVPGRPEMNARLETRFFVVGKEGRTYGVSYHWNEAGTEAYLATTATSREIDVFTETGDLAYTQTWDFPNRGQCMTCHTNVAGNVLGVRTHQLNGNLTYPRTGRTVNQLTHLNNLGAFTEPIAAPGQYPKSYSLNDESASLDLRVRSYLDANCAGCHQQGSTPNVNMDLRFHTPDALRNIFNAPVGSHASTPGLNRVEPGHHERSELWLRDASTTSRQMPPIGRNSVDETWVEQLAIWIDRLPTDPALTPETLIYPNPVDNFFTLRLADGWPTPTTLQLHDSAGRLLHRETLQYGTRDFDASFLPSGVLLLTLEAPDGSREVRRVVKR